MAREPKVGDYVVIFSPFDKDVLVQGYVAKIRATDEQLYVGFEEWNAPNDDMIAYRISDGDYIIKEELLKSQLGSIIWRK